MSRLRPSVTTGALSRRALDGAPSGEVLPQGDPRIDMLVNAVVSYDRREDFVREISAMWTRAQATFLTIGKYLTMAKERLPHGEFNAMVERDLPFGPNTAYQLRAAAEAVESGRLPMAQLPSNYSTIYMLSTLPDAALERARKAGPLRPDLKRSEVVAFKRRVVVDEQPDRAEIRRRRLAALRRQLAEIQTEIANLEAEEAAEA